MVDSKSDSSQTFKNDPAAHEAWCRGALADLEYRRSLEAARTAEKEATTMDTTKNSPLPTTNERPTLVSFPTTGPSVGLPTIPPVTEDLILPKAVTTAETVVIDISEAVALAPANEVTDRDVLEVAKDPTDPTGPKTIVDPPHLPFGKIDPFDTIVERKEKVSPLLLPIDVPERKTPIEETQKVRVQNGNRAWDLPRQDPLPPTPAPRTKVQPPNKVPQRNSGKTSIVGALSALGIFALLLAGIILAIVGVTKYFSQTPNPAIAQAGLTEGETSPRSAVPVAPTTVNPVIVAPAPAPTAVVCVPTGGELDGTSLHKGLDGQYYMTYKVPPHCP